MSEYIVNFLNNKIDDFVLHERIIRCGDCEHRYDNQCGRNLDWFDIKPNGFCAWGKRKD